MGDEKSLTREQWTACESSLTMICFLEGKMTAAIGRALVRFSFACCLRLERFIPPKRRQSLAVIKRCTDKQAATEEVAAAILKSLLGWEPPIERNGIVRDLVADALWAFVKHKDNPLELARAVVVSTQQVQWHRGKHHREEAKAQARLLREMVRYPRSGVVNK